MLPRRQPCALVVSSRRAISLLLRNMRGPLRTRLAGRGDRLLSPVRLSNAAAAGPAHPLIQSGLLLLLDFLCLVNAARE